MGMPTASDDDVIGGINVTPFVDIVLVLLIVFMVTSSVIANAAIEVDLPRAASGGESVATTLNIVITKEGQLTLNGDSSDRDGIAAFIRREKSETTSLQAVISADTDVDYGAVIAIIDLVKTEGVSDFALNIERSSRP